MGRLQSNFQDATVTSLLQCRVFNNGTSFGQTFSNLLVFTTIIFVLCCVLAGVSYLASVTSAQDVEKRSEYECGFAPFDGATRQPFEIHFFLTGILFLIFDVELALLFPWVFAASSSELLSFASMSAFILILSIGFYYEWKRGALIWPARYAIEKVSTATARVGHPILAYF
jgi:NADH:ubiquinone oxidoreductase subunit 3 (subunit A)